MLSNNNNSNHRQPMLLHLPKHRLLLRCKLRLRLRPKLSTRLNSKLNNKHQVMMARLKPQQILSRLMKLKKFSRGQNQRKLK